MNCTPIVDDLDGMLIVLPILEKSLAWPAVISVLPMRLSLDKSFPRQIDFLSGILRFRPRHIKG